MRYLDLTTIIPRSTKAYWSRREQYSYSMYSRPSRRCMRSSYYSSYCNYCPAHVIIKLLEKSKEIDDAIKELEAKEKQNSLAINYLLEKDKQNTIITDGRNVIQFIDSAAIYTTPEKRTVRVEVDLPTLFDSNLYVGRVYTIDLEFIVFLANLDKVSDLPETVENAEKNHDIVDSKIVNFNRSFVFDNSWKYPIEPYDINAPKKEIILPDLFNVQYSEYIDEVNDLLIYEFDLNESQYFIIENTLRLTSIYPKQQDTENLRISYDLIKTPEAPKH